MDAGVDGRRVVEFNDSEGCSRAQAWRRSGVGRVCDECGCRPRLIIFLQYIDIGCTWQQPNHHLSLFQNCPGKKIFCQIATLPLRHINERFLYHSYSVNVLVSVW